MNNTRKNRRLAHAFTSGQIVRAVVRNVGEGCVHFSVPNVCSAVLSAKAFGEGDARDCAMRALKIGNAMTLKVKAWYPANRQLVFEGIVENPPKAKAHGEGRIVKPQYQLLRKGTMFLVDGANYLGKFQPEDATAALNGLVAGLDNEGMRCLVFLERRAWTWYLHRQPTAAAESAFKTQCEKLGVSVVHGDVDAIILQTLEAISDCVGLTSDHFTDYAKVYPDLVRSERIRAFDVTRFDESFLVTIKGIRQAIKIDLGRQAIAASPKILMPVTEPDEPDGVAEVDREGEDGLGQPPPEKVRHMKMFAAARAGGLYGQGSWLLEQGKVAAAVRCFQRVAEKDARGFAGLAAAYAIGGDGIEKDDKKSAKYWSMRERFQKIQRECSRRRRRLQLERLRGDRLIRCA